MEREEKKAEVMTVLLSKSERDALERECRAVDLSRSAYMRRAVRISLGLGVPSEVSAAERWKR